MIPEFGPLNLERDFSGTKEGAAFGGRPNIPNNFVISYGVDTRKARISGPSQAIEEALNTITGE